MARPARQSPGPAGATNHSRLHSVGRPAAVGALAGILSGLLGIGGGIVLVPGLLWSSGIDRRTATGTSLVAIVPISLAAAVAYARVPGGQSDVAASGVMVAGSLVGALVGAALNARVSERTLRRVFAVLTGALGIRLLLPIGLDGGSSSLVITAVAGLALAAIGLGGGLMSGLIGVGGSALTLPSLVLVLGTDQVLAQGIALASVIPTALVGAAA